jgi:hypothetical protein
MTSPVVEISYEGRGSDEGSWHGKQHRPLADYQLSCLVGKFERR